MATEEEKQAIIVTFHRKDRRRDQSSDKVELARRMVKDAGGILDVDLYDAPILILNATTQEIERLRNDANIAAVEEGRALQGSRGRPNWRSDAASRDRSPRGVTNRCASGMGRFPG